MKVRSFLPVLIGLCLTVSLSGYSLYERNGLGNAAGTFDARLAAMGGTGIADGHSLLNPSATPANLGFMSSKMQFQASAGFLRDDDRRSIALYDSFDEVVDEGTYAENDNIYDDYAFSAAFRSQMGPHGFALGFAFRPLVNFDCSYEEEVRTDSNQDNNTYPPVIAINTIDGSGNLSAYGIDLSYDTTVVPYLEKLAIGLEIAPVSGAYTLRKEIEWTQAARDSVQTFELPDYYHKVHSTFDGTRITIATRAQVDGRLGLGISYAPKTTLDTKTAINNADVDVDDGTLPSTLHWGLSYQPRNTARTVFNVDMEWVRWEDVDKLFDNTMRYSLGVEHKLGNALPLRLGFRYETSPLDKSLAMPTFTAGTGFDMLEHWHLDIAGEFSNRNYQALDLFPDSYYDDTQYTDAAGYTSALWNYVVPTDRDWSNPDKVEEVFVKVMTTVTFTW